MHLRQGGNALSPAASQSSDGPDIGTADVAGFAVSAGILTAGGGRATHAALPARQLAEHRVVECGHLSWSAPHADRTA
jgi:hypothetical protein